MNILKLIHDNKAKLSVGLLPSGNLLISVSNDGEITQQQVSQTYVNATGPESQHALLSDLILTNKDKASKKIQTKGEQG